MRPSSYEGADPAPEQLRHHHPALIPWGVAWALVVAGLAACPIPPDNPPDGGSDGGLSDAGVVDGGLSDAGTVSGSIGCTVGLSTGTALVAWLDADLAGTTGGQNGSSYEVNLVGSSATAGQITLAIAGLQPGSQTGALTSAAYETPTSSDSWSCSFPSSACSPPTFAIQAFDGTHLIGTFDLQFFQQASANDDQPASLTSGTFNVTLE